MNPIKGSIVALVTPFHEDGSVNFEKLKELLSGTSLMAPTASSYWERAGESSTMTMKKMMRSLD